MKKVFLTLALSPILLISACSQKNTVVSYTVQTVKTDTVRTYGERPCITYPGKIKAASDINIAFRISGTIAKVYVDAGNHVKKGQILAEIDSRDYEIQLAATEAEYKSIKSEAERVIALYEKKGVTPNDYDKAVYGLKQITAKYEAHGNALADTKLRAPFDGYIQKRLFDANETVAAGMPVISMISGDIPEVEINIPSSEFIRRDKFESFTCTVDIYPDRQFSLELIGIAQKANLNQLYNLRLKMRKDERQLPPPGIVAMVSIYFKTENTSLSSIPLSALFETNGVSTVWIYDKDSETVEARTVTMREILTNGTVVVSEGLNVGEIVVSAGVHSLRQGEKVKLLPAVSPTNTGGLL
jgi:RND family efflux transporter MFP subunit